MSLALRRRPAKATHSTDISIEMIAHGNSSEIVATVEFTVTPFIPATWWDPAEGGEIEVQGVTRLYREQRVFGKMERIELEIPGWLHDWIIESVDHDRLAESVEGGDR
jgi:hypothetical protein